MEIDGELLLGAGLRWGWVLEILAVELRGSGKRDFGGEFGAGDCTVCTGSLERDVDFWVPLVQSAV